MPKSALFIQLFRQNTDLWQTQTQTDGQRDRHRAIASTRASPVWARERCRISPPRFLAECCKRQLNQGSFVLLYFRLSTFSDLYWVCLSVFSCTVLFVSISQVIGCEDRLRNYLYCVEWCVKLYSNQPTNFIFAFLMHVLTPKSRPKQVLSSLVNFWRKNMFQNQQWRVVVLAKF